MAKILIVDNAKEDLKATKSLLEKAGYETLCAENGADAVTCARFKAPDLMLVEENIPGLNAFQVTSQLHRYAKTSAIPVIIMSNKNQKTDQLWGLQQGAVAFLVKPLEKNTLLSCISESLQKASRLSKTCAHS